MSRVAIPLVVVAVTATSALSAPTLKDRPATDPDLVGDWVLKSLTHAGVPVPVRDVAAHTEFTADGERISRNRNGIIVSTVRYSADRSRTPRALDVWTAGDGRVTLSGVYVRDGDVLTIYYVTDPTADRPAKLEAPAGSKVFMAVYERRRKE
jgi:uncharacterized protein (TIGR03067 family)